MIDSIKFVIFFILIIFYKYFMRKQLYTKLQENSDHAESSNPDVEINIPVEKQFMRMRRGNSKNSNEPKPTGGTIPIGQKHKDMKSIYLDGLNKRADVKSRTAKVQNKINADQLIKVLQNGRDRRNLRGKKNQTLSITKAQQDIQTRRAPGEPPQDHRVSKSELMSARQVSTNRASSSRNVFEPPQTELKIRKVLKEMKEEEKRISKLKQESEWKQIQNLLISKFEKESIKDSPEKEKERANRRHELEAAKELLTGKVSIVWIFVIDGQLDETDKNKIAKMYNGLSDTPFVVPLCRRAAQINTFLSIPNSLFKIVADLENFGEAIKNKNNNKIVEFYVYNNQGEKGIAKALAYKAESRKVKGIFSSLKKLIDRAEDQIQNQVQIFQTKKGLTKKNNSKKFPSFIKLSGEDKTYATLYRANLYGAKNMQRSEIRQRYNEFISLVEEKYGTVEYEVNNIIDYQKLNHFQKEISLTQARQVIKFYVRQSFYYQILNSMLRTMKTTEEFKPCIFPFYETYHSIKKFYTLDLQQNNRKIGPQTLYRGAKLRERDFHSLQPGVFIEMLGFMSTSKSLERAREFCDRDGYIFVIDMPSLIVPQKYNKYDHGFVDINKHKLASKEFSIEQQVLFNALNVFKITKIVKDGSRHYIHMQYATIFNLLNKEKDQLTSDEKDVLINYQYCAHMLDQIEDQGDVYMLANQYEESKQYYKQKINQDKEFKENKDGKYYYKLANVQQQCGELDAANKNVQISLKMQIQNLDLNDREKCLKVFSIHSKNAEISLDQEDYLTADEAITHAIQMLDDDNLFEKAKKLRERGYVKFKKGQIIDAEKDFEKSELIFKNLTNKATEKKKSINRKYYFSFLTLLCSSTTQQQIQKEKMKSLKEIEMIEKEIRDMEELINEQLIKVNNSLKQVANYAEDKEKYEICVKKARAYLLGVQSRSTNDPIQKAKLKALEATIQDYLQLAESEKLLYEAIQLVESTETFNPAVGKYSEILANLQKKQLQKYSNPKEILYVHLEKGMAPIKYDEQEHSKVYDRCKKNFEKAINVLLYNNKTKDLPEIISLKNQLGELEFYENKFESSEKIIKEAKEIVVDGGHSQISRSSLLLSKIGYARGQLRNSFQNVEEAFKTLRNAIVKKQEQKYIKIFESNDLLLQIKLQRSKIYLKQLHHDMSLKDLDSMKSSIEKKIDQKDNHSLLADIYEIRAENLIASNGNFESEFYKALKLRERQIGEINLANAVTYCNFAKYLILVKEFEEAEAMLHKALEIFSCFSEEHPITWLVLYCTGLLKQKKQHYEDSIKYIRKSLQKAQKKYDKGHINVNKIRLQYAKALQKSGRTEQAIKQFQSLQMDLEDQLNASQARNAILEEKDDEKITVKKFLYQSLKESYRERTKIDTTNLNQTTLALDRCERKINDMKKTFNIEAPNYKQ